MNNKELSKLWTILSSIIPPIGIILYFIHRKSSPKKAKKAFGSAMIGIPVGFVMGRWVMPFVFGY